MIYGEYEQKVLNPQDLVVLPQVRQTKNARLDDLVDSIDSAGLINQIDVAKMTYEELFKHIAFINKLWKKQAKIENYHPVDGFYYVVIAGHTRLLAIKELNKKKKKANKVKVKIHKAKNSEEILAVQLNENIYSETRVEERAIAIIETYNLGLQSGKWHNRAEFIKNNPSKFSKGILNDALAFANLPIDIQEYIFNGNMPYTVGVELGRICPLIEKYEADFNENKIAEPVDVNLHLSILTTRLTQAKSIKRALQIISAHARQLNDRFRPKEEVQQELFDWFMSGPEREAEQHRRELLAEYKRHSQELNSMPFEKFINFFNFDSALSGVDHAPDIASLRKLYQEYIVTRYMDGEFKIDKNKGKRQ